MSAEKFIHQEMKIFRRLSFKDSQHIQQCRSEKLNNFKITLNVSQKKYSGRERKHEKLNSREQFKLSNIQEGLSITKECGV